MCSFLRLGKSCTFFSSDDNGLMICGELMHAGMCKPTPNNTWYYPPLSKKFVLHVFFLPPTHSLLHELEKLFFVRKKIRYLASHLSMVAETFFPATSTRLLICMHDATREKKPLFVRVRVQLFFSLSRLSKRERKKYGSEGGRKKRLQGSKNWSRVGKIRFSGVEN